ncbi:MAG: glycosyltransferase family 2 protein [Candidatus Omnitrophica bacterium]|nr:glycosyltransferase family 2 protein [Candidatus Omnitrophota bacterium]MCM8802023.1 glycosyltransferase family 2 protein [Candidatus Omnitrophota bacterium]
MIKLNFQTIIRKMEFLQKDKRFPKIYIIVVNWNGWKDTIECLESLLSIEYPNYKIIVVDNGSSDDSLKYMIDWTKGNINIESKFITLPFKKPIKFSLIEWQGYVSFIPEDSLITFIKNKKNAGYSGGNNIGIQFALKNKADFTFILNNDTVVDKNILKEFLSAYEIFGPACYGAKFYYYSNPKKIQFSGVIFDFLRMNFYNSCFNVNNFKEIFYAYGAGFFLPCSIFEEIGLFDERLLLFEENDLCCRIKKKGYKIILVPTAIIYHKVSSSFNKNKANIVYFYTRSRFLWVKKNLNIFWKIWLFLVFTLDLLWSFLVILLEFPIVLLISLFKLLKCIIFQKSSKESFTFIVEKVKHRVLKIKMKILGFRDYMLRKFCIL